MTTTSSKLPEPSGTLACPPLLEETRQGGTRLGAYVEPSDDDRRAARAAAPKLLANGGADLASFGFEEVPLEAWPGAALLREKPDRRRGGGAYVFRRGSTSTVVVMAPHTFFDEGTLPLACELFQRTHARALFVNTTHRYKSSPAGPDGKHPSDVAHAPTSIFQAMAEGVVEAIPHVTVVQLHGFANHEVAAKAVVSSGEKRVTPLVARAAAALAAATGGAIAKYPDDTNELGATTNVQGAVVRRAGGRFLHVEMEDGLRRDLLADAALRAKVLNALGGILVADE